MLRRIPFTPVSDLDEVVALLAAAPGPAVVILDADNTLVRQGADEEEYADAVNGTVDRLEQLKSVARVIVATNGPDRGVPHAINRADKPWTSRERLGLDPQSDASIWVVGDQVLTDGLLAWRLRARFVHLTLDPKDPYPGQARMRRLGKLVAPLLLRKEA